MDKILSVSSLNLYVKSILEQDENLRFISVEGELSNFKKYPSGHCYFSLKDATSAIRGVMFSFYASNLSFKPENGMKVIVKGKVSLYEKSGDYQINVTDMFLSGEGAYRLAFERLKEKLEKEGLFDTSRKKTLPAVPFKVGVATSVKGAALHDILSTAKRRFPCAQIVLAPCAVQGQEAEASVVGAIKALDRADDIQVIIIARGGGSKEDLWVFNSEEIARAAFACKKPTVSAIGHEIDFSILDFVCDIRAATPTAAAEIVFPDRNSLYMNLISVEKSLSSSMDRLIKYKENQLKLAEKSDGFIRTLNMVRINQARLKSISQTLKAGINSKLEKRQLDLKAKTQILEQQSPLANLKRGYALIYKDNAPAKDYNFTVGETVQIVTYSQKLECEVKKCEIRKD